MNMLDLPPEILLIIFRDLLDISRPQNLFALGAVNRLFSHYILQTISQYGFPSSTDWRDTQKMSCELFGKIAAARCKLYHYQDEAVLSRLNHIAKAYQALQSSGRSGIDNHYLETVCYLFWEAELPVWGATIWLKRRATARCSPLSRENATINPPHYKLSTDMLNLAIYYEKVELVLKLLQMPETSSTGYGVLGVPLVLSAKMARLEIFSILLDLDEPSQSRSRSLEEEDAERQNRRARRTERVNQQYGIDLQTFPRVSPVRRFFGGVVEVAARANHWSIFELLHAQRGSLCSLSVIQVMMVCASWAGHLDLVKKSVLLHEHYVENHFDPHHHRPVSLDFCRKLHKGSPLCSAACRGHLEIVRFLLHAGASPNYPNTRNYGRSGTKETPIILATEMGHLSVVKALRDAGAVIDMTTAEASHRVA